MTHEKGKRRELAIRGLEKKEEKLPSFGQGQAGFFMDGLERFGELGLGGVIRDSPKQVIYSKKL